jgi:hypothetical protein
MGALGGDGGTLMLRGPEAAYPAIDGSHAWMKEKIGKDLAARFGSRVQTRRIVENAGWAALTNPLVGLQAAAADVAQPKWDYVLVSDQQSEAEYLAGRATSYTVLIRDNTLTKPQWNVMTRDDGKAFRYRFDSDENVAKRRADHEAERCRVLTPEPGIANKISWVN